MRKLLVFASALLLAGCMNGVAERQAELAPLVGQSENAVVQRLGVPTRTYDANGVKYLAYVDSRVGYDPGGPYFGGYYYRGGWYGGWYGAGFPPTVYQYSCETTFEVANGTVRSFALHGSGCQYSPGFA